MKPQSSGQSSPGSALSESYLRHSPFKLNESEVIQTPSPQGVHVGVFPEGSSSRGPLRASAEGQTSFGAQRGSVPHVRSVGQPRGSSLRKSTRKTLDESFSSARKSLGFSRGFGTPSDGRFYAPPPLSSLLPPPPSSLLSPPSSLLPRPIKGIF